MKKTTGLCLVWVAALAATLGAHDVPLDVLTYVKAEGAMLRVLVRIPVAFLADARLPLRSDAYLDLRNIEAPLAAVAADVARNLDVMEGDRPLPSPRASWIISRIPDSSFDTYDDALARLVAPRPSVNEAIDPSGAAVDLELEYPIASDEGRFSVRVNAFRASNRASQMTVMYLTPAGGTRTVITSGEPRRVALEPRWQEVGTMFGRLGIDELALAALHLGFLLCLAIPRHRRRAAVAAFGMFAAGLAATLTVSAVVPGPPNPSQLVVFQTMSAAALVVAALQNITVPHLKWVRLAAVVFGLMDGLVLGFAYRQNVQLAGSHTFVSLMAFALPILLGSLWLLLIAQPVVGLVYRSRLPERWAIVFLSAIPIHAGLHGLLGR